MHSQWLVLLPVSTTISDIGVVGKWYIAKVWYILRGSQSLQNLITTFQRYCQPVLILKMQLQRNNGKKLLINPGTSSSQSEGYSSKWPKWLVCRVPSILTCTSRNTCPYNLIYFGELLPWIHQQSLVYTMNLSYPSLRIVQGVCTTNSLLFMQG